MSTADPTTWQPIIEDVEWLLKCGEHPTRIAKRVGRTVSSLSNGLGPNGRPDLAAHFMAEHGYVNRSKR